MQNVRRLAECLLDPTATPETLERTCSELYINLLEASGFDPIRSVSDAVDTPLPNGTALAPHLAALCVLDTNRTVAFVRGLWAAIHKAQRRFPLVSLEVVYAGTGPLAPLAIPLMTLLDPGVVVFTLIDVNARSVEAVRRLISRLGLSHCVGRIVRADATCYKHPVPVHVAVTETMQRALSKEPFVAIVRN